MSNEPRQLTPQENERLRDAESTRTEAAIRESRLPQDDRLTSERLADARAVLRFLKQRVERLPTGARLDLPVDLFCPKKHVSDEAQMPPCTVKVDLHDTLRDIDIGAGIGTLGISWLIEKIAGAAGVDIDPSQLIPRYNDSIGRVFPEWIPVNDFANDPAILEGEVVGVGGNADVADKDLPHVSQEDFPTSHYTHDFNFAVKPDPDQCNTNLLGIQRQIGPDPCAEQRRELEFYRGLLEQDLQRIPLAWRALGLLGDPPQDVLDRGIAQVHQQWDPIINGLRQRLASPDCQIPSSDIQQDLIEVEWEIGLGARNDGNLCTESNVKGESCGFFSAGHRREERIWNWPTSGDRVHLEGMWIWDAGHPPAETEIHPPRFIAVQRRLPSLVSQSPQLLAQLADDRVFASRVDIFASGDGGALRNNRTSTPAFPRPPFVEPVAMGASDYRFEAKHVLPRPGPNALLRWFVEGHSGDTFPQSEQPQVEKISADSVRVSLPYSGGRIPDQAVFARTLYLYWDDASGFRGVPVGYGMRAFQVTIEKVLIRQDSRGQTGKKFFFTSGVHGGLYRLFVEVGGEWACLNEFSDADDILNDGFASSGDSGDTWTVNLPFFVYMPPTQPGQLAPTFRVHTSGWLANGVDELMGNLLDPNSSCHSINRWANDKLLTLGVLKNGGGDEPTGFVHSFFNQDNNFGLGDHGEPKEHVDRSRYCGGGRQPTTFSNYTIWDIDPNDQYRLCYRIEEVPIA